MNIIIGLGNPGEKYAKTRHNVGFIALNYIAEKKGLSWKTDKKFNALIAKDDNTLYIKPLTFMNNSGLAVQYAMSYYKLLPKKLGIMKEKNADLSDILTIIHDDLDIEFGKIKNGINRGPAGHNGIKSIISHLKTKNFKRIRIGIKGEKPEQMKTSDYVLARFTNNEEEELHKNIIPTIKL